MELAGLGKNGPYTTRATLEDISLVSINPINGVRNDQNVTEFRAFLIELDDGCMPSEWEYVEVEVTNIEEVR